MCKVPFPRMYALCPCLPSHHPISSMHSCVLLRIYVSDVSPHTTHSNSVFSKLTFSPCLISSSFFSISCSTCSWRFATPSAVANNTERVGEYGARSTIVRQLRGRTARLLLCDCFSKKRYLAHEISESVRLRDCWRSNYKAQQERA